MSFEIYGLENSNVVTNSKGEFEVLEHQSDRSCNPQEAQLKYYMSMQDVRKRQLKCDLSMGGVTLSPGAMQWMVGDVQMTTGIKGAGDLVGKMFGAKVTGESAIKPVYKGTGVVVTEPTYKHLLLVDLADWGGSIVVNDGFFYASSASIKLSVEMIKSFSGAVAGGEGLFNLKMSGRGVAVLESAVPEEELVTVELNNDTIKIDGSYAIAWSPSLKFTVERSSKTLLGSAMAGEGLVNVYTGTGRVIMMPEV